MINKITLLLLLFVVAATASSDLLQTNVTSDANSISITIESGDLQPLEINENGLSNSYLTIPNEGTTYERNKPLLPAVSRFIVVPPDARLELSLQADEPRRIRSDYSPILCDDETIILNQSRDDNPLYPTAIAEMSEPFVMRGIRMVKVTTYPVQYDSRDNSYLIRDNIVASVRFVEGDPVNPVHQPNRRHLSREFLKFIEAFAINGADVGRDNPDNVSPYVGHYLIVTHENCLEYAVPFIEWRRKAGYKMDILSIAAEVAEENPRAIKEAIQERYDTYLDAGVDPFDQILLIGDRDSYNNYASEWILDAETGDGIWGGLDHADYLYACLEGDDPYPDAGFARFASGSEDLMELVVGRTLAYEAEPFMEETEWFTKGAVFSEHWGLDENSAWHISIPMNVRWGVDILQSHGFDDIETYEDLVWDRFGEDIIPWMRDIFNEGRNVLIGRAQIWNWNRHFHDGMDANVIFPIYIATNGMGSYAGDSMHRTPVGEQPKGAVLNTFVYGNTPTIPMSNLWLEMVNAVMQRDMSAGWARVMAITALERYIPDFQYQNRPVYLHVKTDFECYGDPGLQPWIGVPRRVTVDAPESVSEMIRLIELSVMDEDGENPIAGAQVTLYAPGNLPDPDDDDYADYDGMVMFTTVSDADGFVQFVIGDDVMFEPDTPIYLTVTGRDILPLFEEIEIDNPNEAAIEISEYLLVEEDGNDDGDVNPDEIFSLSLSAVNLGNAASENVRAAAISFSPWIEVSDNVVQFGDLDGDAEADGDDAFELTIHPDVPDGEARSTTRSIVRINFTADGDLSWSSAIVLNPVAPCFDFSAVVGGNVINGEDEEVDLDIELANVGRLETPPVMAELVSLGNGIVVVEEESAYDEIGVNDQGRIAENAFVVSVNPIAIPGSKCDMMLLLTSVDNDNFVDTVYFQLQVESQENGPFGPDDYGYICFDDSDEGWDMAPEYDWIEISREERNRDFDGNPCDFDGNSGINGFADIGEAQVIDLPFVAQFYGSEYDQITIASNGFISMGDQAEIINFQNWPMDRCIGGGMGMIAPFWDWLVLMDNRNSMVYYYYDEDNAKFIVEWYKLRHYRGGNSDLTFQLILYDPEVWANESGDSHILFQYKSIQNVRGVEQGHVEGERNNYYASVGISSPDGTSGINYSWLDEYPIGAAELENERAIMFTTVVEFQVAELFGIVVDAENGAPMPDARITTGHGHIIETERDGSYQIENAFAGLSFLVTASAEGYLDSTVVIELEEGEQRELNFALLHSEFELSQEEIHTEILYREQLEASVAFSIRNDGNGPLSWSAEKRLPDNAQIDPWRLRDSYPVGEMVDDSRIRGVVLAQGVYVVTGGSRSDRNDNYVYIIDRDGTHLNSYQQFGESRYGMSDLAWDGDLVWGGEDNVVFGFTPEGELIETFETELDDNKGVAWDKDSELLWVCDILGHDILGYSRDGELVAELPHYDFNIYGMAYWSDDSDGYPLYIYHNERVVDGQDFTVIHKMNPETEETMFVRELGDEDDGKPEGIFITDEFDQYSVVLICIANISSRDELRVWQLESNTAWLDLNSYDGVVNPGQEAELTLNLDATELQVMTDYEVNNWEGELLFLHDALGGSVVVPVRFDVRLDMPYDIESNSPTQYNLTASYPNPFNSQTAILYDVPYQSHVTISVYDLTGRLVNQLIDQSMSAGSHKVRWNAIDNPSGMYLVRMESGSYSSVRKVMLIR